MNSQQHTKRIIEVVLTTTLLAMGFYIPKAFSHETVANSQCGANTGLPCRLQGGGTRMITPNADFEI